MTFYAKLFSASGASNLAISRIIEGEGGIHIISSKAATLNSEKVSLRLL